MSKTAIRNGEEQKKIPLGKKKLSSSLREFLEGSYVPEGGAYEPADGPDGEDYLDLGKRVYKLEEDCARLRKDMACMKSEITKLKNAVKSQAEENARLEEAMASLAKTTEEAFGGHA